MTLASVINGPEQEQVCFTFHTVDTRLLACTLERTQDYSSCHGGMLELVTVELATPVHADPTPIDTMAFGGQSHRAGHLDECLLTLNRSTNVPAIIDFQYCSAWQCPQLCPTSLFSFGFQGSGQGVALWSSMCVGGFALGLVSG